MSIKNKQFFFFLLYYFGIFCFQNLYIYFWKKWGLLAVIEWASTLGKVANSFSEKRNLFFFQIRKSPLVLEHIWNKKLKKCSFERPSFLDNCLLKLSIRTKLFYLIRVNDWTFCRSMCPSSTTLTFKGFVMARHALSQIGGPVKN